MLIPGGHNLRLWSDTREKIDLLAALEAARYGGRVNMDAVIGGAVAARLVVVRAELRARGVDVEAVERAGLEAAARRRKGGRVKRELGEGGLRHRGAGPDSD